MLRSFKPPPAGRYFQNSPDVHGVVDTRKELLESLARINTHNPPVQTCSTGWTFHGLYTGPTSIAYLFYKLSQIYPDVELKNQPLLDWAQAYLDLSQHVRKRDPNPDRCGIANETLAYYTLQAVMLNDISLASKVCSYSILINNPYTILINNPKEDGSSEWLYGRAGYLYFLRLLQCNFTEQQYALTFKQISQAISQTIYRILEIPQPWIWHGTENLGAAHGTIGIITQVVLSDQSTAPKLEPILDQLLNHQLQSGNFPSSLPADGDRLVQFCHGGPGFILSLESIKSYFPNLNLKIGSCITKAREDVWRRGLLTKEPSLCHGIAGNALSLSNWDEVNHFLGFMTSESMENLGWMAEAGRSDDFVSLFTGEAGRAWVWAVADQRLGRTCIGYNDV